MYFSDYFEALVSRCSFVGIQIQEQLQKLGHNNIFIIDLCIRYIGCMLDGFSVNTGYVKVPIFPDFV